LSRSFDKLTAAGQSLPLGSEILSRQLLLL
jgi:hypothetical protein